MFEFFIAFFGGIFSAGKLLSEKEEQSINKRASDIRCEQWTQRLHAWERQVVDRPMQENMWNYVSSHREDAWREVQSAYSSMRHQKNYASANEWAYDGVLDKTKAGKKLYRHHRIERPTDIMLAKQGKLRHEIATSTIAYLSRGEGENSKRKWDSEVEFWIYIRDELRGHGVDARLLFECECQPKKYFDVENIAEFRYQAGKLVWLPCTWVNFDLTPM